MSLTLTIAAVPPIVLSDADLLEIAGWQQGSDGESPSLTLTLDGARLDAARLLDPPPLRAAAVLAAGGPTLFSGLVQAVRLGPAPSITLES